MNSELETPIGTKETKKLEPKKVRITDMKVEMQKSKDDSKDVGKKVIISCKHPDKEEIIEISSVMFVKNKEIKTSGLWYKLDDDKLLSKDSATAAFLKFHNAGSLKEMMNKEVPTDLDDKGYLCFKAY